MNRIRYSIKKWKGVRSESKHNFGRPANNPLDRARLDPVHGFILCIDFKRESKDDSDSGRMEEFRIKAAHQAKNWKELRKERNQLFSAFYSSIINALKG